MQEKYFNELEKKEKLEDKMKTITEIKVKVVCCKQVKRSLLFLLLDTTGRKKKTKIESNVQKSGVSERPS